MDGAGAREMARIERERIDGNRRAAIQVVIGNEAADAPVVRALEPGERDVGLELAALRGEPGPGQRALDLVVQAQQLGTGIEAGP